MRRSGTTRARGGVLRQTNETHNPRSTSMRLLTSNTRRAIQLDDGRLLAVPPFPASTPRAVRVKIYEAVLRRQWGEAEIIAQISTDASTGGSERDRLAAMLAESPYRASVMVQGAA